MSRIYGMTQHHLVRMFQWAVLSVLLYAVVLSGPWPLIVQVALTKGANVNAGAFLGYWVDRTLFCSYDRAFNHRPKDFSSAVRAARLVGRAILTGCCILGLSLGVGA